LPVGHELTQTVLHRDYVKNKVNIVVGGDKVNIRIVGVVYSTSLALGIIWGSQLGKTICCPAVNAQDKHG